MWAGFVTKKPGKQIQDAFFTELLQKMEAISPGVTKNI